MQVEKTKNNQTKVSVSDAINNYSPQNHVGYARYLEATSRSKAKQSYADKLADEVNAGWWAKNRNRFIKQR
jgi:hypothetical protein